MEQRTLNSEYKNFTIEDKMALKEAILKVRKAGNYSPKLEIFKPDSWVYNCLILHRMLFQKYNDFVKEGKINPNIENYQQFLVKRAEQYLAKGSNWEEKTYKAVKNVLVKGDRGEDFFENWLKENRLSYTKVEFGSKEDKEGYDFIIKNNGVNYKVQVKSGKFKKSGEYADFFYSEVRFKTSATNYNILAIVDSIDKKVYLYKKENISDEIVKILPPKIGDEGTVWYIPKKNTFKFSINENIVIKFSDFIKN